MSAQTRTTRIVLTSAISYYQSTFSFLPLITYTKSWGAYWVIINVKLIARDFLVFPRVGAKCTGNCGVWPSPVCPKFDYGRFAGPDLKGAIMTLTESYKVVG